MRQHRRTRSVDYRPRFRRERSALCKVSDEAIANRCGQRVDAVSVFRVINTDGNWRASLCISDHRVGKFKANKMYRRGFFVPGPVQVLVGDGAHQIMVADANPDLVFYA